MNDLLAKLKEFFAANAPAILVNTSTNKSLLCLNPVFEMQENTIFMKFESLNDKGGNSVLLKALQGFEKSTLYLENDEENVLMLQALNLANYNYYIKKDYLNAPEFQDETELKQFILKQKNNAW